MFCILYNSFCPKKSNLGPRQKFFCHTHYQVTLLFQTLRKSLMVFSLCPIDFLHIDKSKYIILLIPLSS